jgi:hypothetical protein
MNNNATIERFISYFAGSVDFSIAFSYLVAVVVALLLAASTGPVVCEAAGVLVAGVVVLAGVGVEELIRTTLILLIVFPLRIFSIFEVHFSGSAEST